MNRKVELFQAEKKILIQKKGEKNIGKEKSIFYSPSEASLACQPYLPKDKPFYRVAGALIRKKDSFLIAQRPKHKARANLWELVGGKLEKGETPEEALLRECKEEMNIRLCIDQLYFDLLHEYEDMCIQFTVFLSHLDENSGEIELLEHQDIRYIQASEIENYSYCAALSPILLKLKKEASLLQTKQYESLLGRFSGTIWAADEEIAYQIIQKDVTNASPDAIRGDFIETALTLKGKH